LEESAIEDVNQELSVLKECSSSYIVKYFGSYFHNEDLWVRRRSWVSSNGQIVMEYCEAGSVGDILKITNTSFTEDQICKICRQVLKVETPKFFSLDKGARLHS
jgi:serine/threonine protein kinase